MAAEPLTVAVTGGTGFIGSRLVRRHAGAGDAVRVLTRRTGAAPAGGVALVRGDLTDPAIDLAGLVEGADILYHCAAELRDASRMRALHVDGTARLIEAARGRIGRWVQLSSVGAYGSRHDGTLTEDSPLLPSGDYEETKTAADHLVATAAEEGAFDLCILRPSSVFGAGMPSRAVRELIAAIDRRRFFFIGGRVALTNLIHVDNVVDALWRCGTMAEASGRTFLVADSNTLEVCVGAIADALGKAPPRLHVPEPPVRLAARLLAWMPGMPLTERRIDALVRTARYSTERIERELGYRRLVSLEAGLQECVAEWRKQR